MIQQHTLRPQAVVEGPSLEFLEAGEFVVCVRNQGSAEVGVIYEQRMSGLYMYPKCHPTYSWDLSKFRRVTGDKILSIDALKVHEDIHIK